MCVRQAEPGLGPLGGFAVAREEPCRITTSPPLPCAAASRTCSVDPRPLGGIFEYPGKVQRLRQVRDELAAAWSQPRRARELGRKQALLERIVSRLDRLDQGVREAEELLALATEEGDDGLFAELASELDGLQGLAEELEFQRMFRREMDPCNAYLDVQAGSGGTEAQDWAEMLLRMYLRWAERRRYKAELLEVSPGEEAGTKSASVRLSGDYAYGWLRTETGIHRLVRKSPFDSGHRRHTSFAAVFVAPEVNEEIDVTINPADLRIDTYRASGAGGQHVNKTDSAVRITHQPSGIVVQCQSDRSQHRNREQAMKQLRARLYERELRQRKERQQAQEDGKADIGWGSQIRSYVLDQSRIKDLRTGHETGNVQAVLDGGLDAFLEASLKRGL